MRQKQFMRNSAKVVNRPEIVVDAKKYLTEFCASCLCTHLLHCFLLFSLQLGVWQLIKSCLAGMYKKIKVIHSCMKMDPQILKEDQCLLFKAP